MIRFIDTHAHLGDDQFAADREAVLERAAERGVERVVEIADRPADWAKAIALSRARPYQVRCSLGLHPYYASEFSDAALEDLSAKIRLPEVVAIGEIGLDYVKSSAPRDIQLCAFRRLLRACRDWEFPAVIHCRAAYGDLRPILGEVFAGPPKGRRFRGVVHCFSGDREDALACAGLGFALGVDGPVTYPKNEPLREVFRAVGPACLVLETDSPYLPPQSSRGKRNEPAAIPEIGERLAQALGVPLEELARITTANALDLFGLPPTAQR